MLYMLGQRIIDERDESQKCLIKVGFSKNVDERIYAHKTSNPSAIHISSTAGVRDDEIRCHRYFAENGKKYFGEWYEVPNYFYKECLKKGFSNFPLKRKNQRIYMYI